MAQSQGGDETKGGRHHGRRSVVAAERVDVQALRKLPRPLTDRCSPHAVALNLEDVPASIRKIPCLTKATPRQIETSRTAKHVSDFGSGKLALGFNVDVPIIFDCERTSRVNAVVAKGAAFKTVYDGPKVSDEAVKKEESGDRANENNRPDYFPSRAHCSPSNRGAFY